MNHPPLEVLPNIKVEDNEYLCSDLRDSAQYVNSFHVYFTLTTNITKELKNDFVESIFSPLFHSVKEMTAFFDDHCVSNADDFRANWSFHKDRMKAKNPVKNQALWKELKQYADRLTVEWRWVRAHSGDPLNELCDSMVSAEISRFANQ